MNLNTCTRCGHKWHSRMIAYQCNSCLYNTEQEREAFTFEAYNIAMLFVFVVLVIGGVVAIFQ